MVQTEAPSNKEEKIKALEAASVDLQKTHGKGSIIRMGSREIVPVAVISTGVYGIDNKIIQVGGIPRGRITEIFGPEASGKTTLALQVVAQAQQAGGTAAYIDAEHSLDPIYAASLGVDVENLFISQPDSGEQALEIAKGLIDTRAVDVVVIDSVAALVPQAELDGEFGDSNMGLHARLMSQAMRMLTGKVQKSSTALIFINQIREKIGVMFGSPETTTGGRALKFYASLRLDIRRIAQLKDGDELTGNKTRVKAVKNKLASPFKEGEFELIYGKGFDNVASIADCAIAENVFTKDNKSWFSFEGQKFNGRGQVIDALRNDPKLVEKVMARMDA
jgi:recombination protein RecA